MPGYATPPIVAMTANAFEADRRDCFTAGMSHFMTKPVYPDALFDLIFDILHTQKSPI